MVPESPTVTNNPVVVELSVLVVSSSLLLLQEMKMELKRRRIEMRRISRYFTKFPNWLVQENLSYTRTWFVLQCVGILLGRGVDCEELVGVTHRR